MFNDVNDLRNWLKTFPKSICHGTTLGCDYDIEIITEVGNCYNSLSKGSIECGCNSKRDVVTVMNGDELVSSHSDQVIDAIRSYVVPDSKKRIFTRVPTEYASSTCLYTRIQLGHADKIITPEQYELILNIVKKTPKIVNIKED